MPDKTVWGVHRSTPTLGSFKALTESKTKMKVVTWQTTPLLSYEDGKDLRMILMTNAVQRKRGM